MSNNHYYITIRSSGKKVPVSEEMFWAYLKENDEYRRDMQQIGVCKCPARRFMRCDGDCDSCQYGSPITDVDSLDAKLPDDDDEEDETGFYEFLVSKQPEPWDKCGSDTQYSRRERVRKILARLKELMPEAEKVGQMRMEGKSLEKIAQELGMKRYQLRFKLERLRRILRKEFRDWI